MSLPAALENAAAALAGHADVVRDANGDPDRLLEVLSTEAASEVLAWLLTHEADAGQELAIAWSDCDTGVAPLESLDEASLPKPGRKALRKALHRLRSRGVAVAGAPVASQVARLPEIDEKIESALVSPLDPSGARMAYLVLSHATRGARIYEALIDDLRGISEFRVYDTGRSRARRFLRELAGRANAAMVEIPAASWRALIAHAVAHQPAERPAPRAFAESRSQLGLDAAGPLPSEEVVAALGEPSDPEPAALARVADQVKSGGLGPWPPPIETLRSVAEEIREGLDAKVIVSGAAREERKRDVLAKAAAGIYGEEFARVTAARFRETAFVAWRSGREDEARDHLAAAVAFTAPAAQRENPVAIAFVERLMAPLLTELDSEPAAEDESSLPAEP